MKNLLTNWLDRANLIAENELANSNHDIDSKIEEEK